MTEVIHIKDAPKGWKSNPQYVYIGRGSKWGNQFSHVPHSHAKHRVKSRDEACEKFEEHQLPGLLPQIGELKDKVLVCFCHPQRCHGDSLAKEANK